MTDSFSLVSDAYGHISIEFDLIYGIVNLCGVLLIKQVSSNQIRKRLGCLEKDDISTIDHHGLN